MPQLLNGQTMQVHGSGSNVYTLKYVGGVYSCSCPAWRNQSLPIDQRNCKHLLREGFSNTATKPPSVPFTPAPKAVPVQSHVLATQPVLAPSVNGGSEYWNGTTSKEPPVLLAHVWDTAEDMTGWWMSEKLDGVRAYWTGKRFLSRLGNEFHAPAWFTKDLPNEILDGELWIGRKMFQQTVGAVKKLVPDDAEWRKITFMVFDAPDPVAPFEARMNYLEHLLSGCAHAKPVAQIRCKGITHLRTELKRVQALGGEGLMMRKAGSAYEAGRSYTLLKVKEFMDAEGTVTGYEPGKGKHKGRVGALIIRADDGKEFKAGTGMTDKERSKPPSIGSRVTYRYQELTNDGIPRFPTFVSARDYE
jgi:DNA ligase-1